MTRDSFVFYRSFKNALSKLSDADRLAAYDALTDYCLDGLEEADGVPAAIIEAFKPLIDANNKRFENGLKGGRPKSNQIETKEEPTENQTETKTEPNHNLNEKCEMRNENKEIYSTRKRKPKARQPSFSNQRNYDYGTLEVQLLGRAYE